MLKFDRAELHLGNRGITPLFSPEGKPGKNRDSAPFSCGKKGAVPGFPKPERRRTTGGDSLRRTTQTIFKDVREQGDETVRIWARGYYRRATDGLSDGMLKIDLPLDSNGARLFLMKDLRRDSLNYYTLRRLEHLRRTLLSNLARLQK